MTRPAALAPVVLAALLLGGCTSNVLGQGAAPQPTPTPTESETPAPEPTAAPPLFACDNVLIEAPGSYVLGECGTVYVEGPGIHVSAATIVELVMRADGSRASVDRLDRLVLTGNTNEITAAVAGEVVIFGDDNSVVVDEEIGTVSVDGDMNLVVAGFGIGSVSDNGFENTIG